MVVGIGTDIVEIARIEKAVRRAAFKERVFTRGEQAYAEGRGAQAQASYAARFAAKEAVMKALGTGLRGGALTEIEVTCDALGAPHAALRGAFAARAQALGVARIHVSLSHSRAYATAVCILESGCER